MRNFKDEVLPNLLGWHIGDRLDVGGLYDGLTLSCTVHWLLIARLCILRLLHHRLTVGVRLERLLHLILHIFKNLL